MIYVWFESDLSEFQALFYSGTA